MFAGTSDPNSQAYVQLYGLMAVMGVIIILAVQAVVSLAIANYFRTHHPGEHHHFRTLFAPLISFAGQTVVLILLFRNLGFIGGGYGYAGYLGPIDAGIFVLAVAAAFYLKRSDPDRFDAIGRLVHDGI